MAQPAPQRRRRVGDVVLICDEQLHCVYASPASVPMLGYLPEALTGSPMFALVHPHHVAATRAFVRHATEDSPSLAVDLLGRDGTAVPFVLTRNGETGVDFAPRDVSERVRMEEWIASERALSDTILSRASDAIISLDRVGTIVGWNHAAESIFGWPRAEILGRTATDTIVPLRFRDEYAEGLSMLFEAGSVRIDEPTEAVMLRHDGTEIMVEVTAWSVQVGQTWRFNSVVRDITVRKQAEAELTRAREQADEASLMKSDFLATMSHEIRTPMNGVIGLADILLATTLDTDQRRYAEGIRTAGTALLTVINDILDFSKVEAGVIVLDETDFDVRELLEEIVDLLAGAARGKGLELMSFCRPEVATWLRGDQGRLRQILLNLCGNAVKFTERGEVVVTASRASLDGKVERIRWEVTDTGIGVRAEDAARLFDAFSQADASTTRRYGGTGLGLAISQRLVRAMGGEIGVMSDIGQGSTFWFEIPLRIGSAPPATQPAQSARSTDLHGLRVLIVDDNATNRFVLETQLREWQMAPTAFATGEAALAALREPDNRSRPYDVAVLDMAMPAMDGLELASRITADRSIPSVHVVLLTSGTEVDPVAARSAGVAAWLTKPVHRSQLFDSLARALAPAAVQAQARRSQPSSPGAVRGRVLLAEDNEVNQMVAVAFLGELGFVTDVADSGAAALDRAEAHDYDAILMDCQMPEMDGYAATAELRRREAGQRHTPVIALTAGAREENRERCLAAGMDDFVSKPIDIAVLRRTLAAWVPGDPDPTDTEVGARAPVAGGANAAEIDDRLSHLHGPDGDGQNLVLRLLASFLDHTPPALDALAEAVRADESDRIAALAHRVRGAAANVGAARLSAQCAALEDAGRRHAPAAPEEMRRLWDEYRQVEPVLRDRLDGSGSGPGPDEPARGGRPA